jgi:hypothetical protein
MSLWKKIAAPRGGVHAMTRRAARMNHARQPSKSRSERSETSGSDVMTLARGWAAFSAIQASASPCTMVRTGGTSSSAEVLTPDLVPYVRRR